MIRLRHSYVLFLSECWSLFKVFWLVVLSRYALSVTAVIHWCQCHNKYFDQCCIKILIHELCIGPYIFVHCSVAMLTSSSCLQFEMPNLYYLIVSSSSIISLVSSFDLNDTVRFRCATRLIVLSHPQHWDLDCALLTHVISKFGIYLVAKSARTPWIMKYSHVHC